MIFKDQKISKEKAYQIIEDDPKLIEFIKEPDTKISKIAFDKDPLTFLLVQELSMGFLSHALYNRSKWIIVHKKMRDSFKRDSQVLQKLAVMSLDGVTRKRVSEFSHIWKKHLLVEKVNNL